MSSISFIPLTHTKFNFDVNSSTEFLSTQVVNLFRSSLYQSYERRGIDSFRLKLFVFLKLQRFQNFDLLEIMTQVKTFVEISI